MQAGPEREFRRGGRSTWMWPADWADRLVPLPERPVLREAGFLVPEEDPGAGMEPRVRESASLLGRLL